MSRGQHAEPVHLVGGKDLALSTGLVASPCYAVSLSTGGARMQVPDPWPCYAFGRLATNPFTLNCVLARPSEARRERGPRERSERGVGITERPGTTRFARFPPSLRSAGTRIQNESDSEEVGARDRSRSEAEARCRAGLAKRALDRGTTGPLPVLLRASLRSALRWNRVASRSDAP